MDLLSNALDLLARHACLNHLLQSITNTAVPAGEFWSMLKEKRGTNHEPKVAHTVSAGLLLDPVVPVDSSSNIKGESQSGSSGTSSFNVVGCGGGVRVQWRESAAHDRYTITFKPSVDSNRVVGVSVQVEKNDVHYMRASDYATSIASQCWSIPLTMHYIFHSGCLALPLTRETSPLAKRAKRG
jgi:hypothetical protein